MEVIIEPHSGFCFGVVSAIYKAEEALRQQKQLYCLGEIVHNGAEVNRLSAMGLQTISIEDFKQLSHCAVLIRAHGEPPETYALAKERDITLIDATCPIVLELQRKVRIGYEKAKGENGQILIFGKKRHAEVIGLEGQTNNSAIVISKVEELNNHKIIDFQRPISLFSQTTQNKEEYQALICELKKRIPISLHHSFTIHKTICGQVSNRSIQLLSFADTVDVLLFVSGKNSSNGQYLYQLCKNHKQETYLLSHADEWDAAWIKGKKKIGISGATSTPMWLMQDIAKKCTSTE